MDTYELKIIKDSDGNDAEVLIRIDGEGIKWTVPQYESNADYQAYLAWKAEQ